MLFDLGDTAPLSPRELLRVSHALVSHSHMDHVAGFDRLLRLRLHRPRPLLLLGPVGFVERTAHRLRSYTWNLLDERSVDFRLTVQEFDGRQERVSRSAEFRAREAFARRDLPAPDPGRGLVLSEPEFEIGCAALDHATPSLAFAFRQRRPVNVWRNALEALGLPVGPWIDAAKQAHRDAQPDACPIAIPGHGTVPLGLLRARVFRTGKGQRFAYVADCADTPANRDRITALAQDVDVLFIEAHFLEADRAAAKQTYHLTARAAGEIARRAGARQVIPFHHSARYGGENGPLTDEVQTAFRGG